MNSVRNEVRKYIIENFALGDETFSFDDDESLLELNLIDSTGVIELVTFIQDQFGITMPDEDITPDNLDSVAKIASYVSQQNTSEISNF